MQSKVMRGNRTTIKHFFQKAALYSTRVLAFPFWESVGFCRLKRSLQSFPLSEKNSANFIFSAKMISLFPSLPLGGKVDKAKLWTNEGQPNNIQAFFQKAALYSTRIPGFPVGEAVGFCRLKRSLHAFHPLPERNSANFISSAKMISLFHRLPLGGKLLAKQGDEGQPNNIQAISLQKAALYSTRILGFPFGEAVGFCRLKRSLHASPPCLKKI